MPWRILVRDNPRSIAREEDRHTFEDSAYNLALDLQLRLISDTNTRLSIKKSLPKNASAKDKLALIHQAIGAFGYAQAFVEQTNTTASGRPMRRSALAARAGMLAREEEPSEEEEPEEKDESDMPTPDTSSAEEETDEDDDDEEVISDEEVVMRPRQRRDLEAEVAYKVRMNSRSRRQLGSPMMRRRLSLEEEEVSTQTGRWRIDSHNIIPQKGPQLIRLTNKVRRTMGPARFFFRG